MAKAAASVTADRWSIKVALDREFLRKLASRDRHFSAALEAFDGRDDGDWGGPDFPTYELTDRDAEVFARLLSSMAFR